jgi:hypothetical protein
VRITPPPGRLSGGAQRLTRAGTRLRPGAGVRARPGLRRLRCVPPRRRLLDTKAVWRLGWRRLAAAGRRAAPATSGSPDAASHAAQR